MKAAVMTDLARRTFHKVGRLALPRSLELNAQSEQFRMLKDKLLITAVQQHLRHHLAVASNSILDFLLPD